MRELLLQWATSQETLAHLPQTVLSCLLLAKKDFYFKYADIAAFVEGLMYVVCTFYKVAKHS